MTEPKTTAPAPKAKRTPKTAASSITKAVATPTVDSFKDQANSFKDKAGDKAREFATTGKDKASTFLESISQAVDELARTVDDKVGTQYGDYARRAATAVSGAADNLKTADVDDLVVGARDFVRKQPAVAIGAAAAVGFLLTRLVRAGGNDSDAA